MNSAELLITFTLSVHAIFLPNKLVKGVIPPSKEGDPLKNDASNLSHHCFLTATADLSVTFFQSCSISIKAT